MALENILYGTHILCTGEAGYSYLDPTARAHNSEHQVTVLS